MTKKAIIVEHDTTDVKGGALMSFVNKALAAHAKSRELMHDAACRVLDHLARHRNVNVINHFLKGMKQNDQDAFRIWIGKYARKENEDGTFTTFLTFKKDVGFTVKQGSPSDHVPAYEVLIKGDSFFDVNQAKEAADMTAEKLLAMIATLSKRVNKKRDEMSEEETAKLARFNTIFGEVDRIAAMAAEAQAKVSPTKH